MVCWYRKGATWLLAALPLVACRSSSEEGSGADPVAKAPSPPVVATRSVPDASSLVVHHAADLEHLDLAVAERIDLALSAADQVGHQDNRDPQTACDGLDLAKLASAAPALRTLRISGCAEAIASGLGSLGSRLHHLELADLELTNDVVSAIASCTALQSLTLTRVKAQDVRLSRLGQLELQSITLADLDKDSDLGETLDLWPKTLKQAHLRGRWAGHDAMTHLADAEALEVLEIEDTRVGNYSLHQIKPLARLRDLTLSGSAFNDHTPLYFRDLPVERFSCDCPRLGDAGVRMLRHSKGIVVLELPNTRITGEGLSDLQELDKLRALVLRGHELDEVSIEAIGALSGLRRLELSGPLTDRSLSALGKLKHLQHLRFDCPELDDRAASALAELTELRTLDLGGTAVSDASLHAVASMSHLRELELDHTRVTNRGLVHLAELSELEVLTLDHTDLVDDAVQHLAGLHNLRVLRLDSTLVTDAALDHLLRLPKLQRLNLAHTVVTQDGLAKLTALPSLEVLGLEGIRG